MTPTGAEVLWTASTRGLPTVTPGEARYSRRRWWAPPCWPRPRAVSSAWTAAPDPYSTFSVPAPSKWQPRLSRGHRVPRRRICDCGVPVSRTSELTSRAAPAAVELPGFTLAALRTGEETNPPVLLVPGWTGSKEDFGPILEPLGEAGFWVTAIDQRGQFRSPFRPDGDYSPIALGNDLRLAAAALGGVCIWSGTRSVDWSRELRCSMTRICFRSLVLLDSGPAGIDDGRKDTLT